MPFIILERVIFWLSTFVFVSISQSSPRVDAKQPKITVSFQETPESTRQYLCRGNYTLGEPMVRVFETKEAFSD